MLNVWGHLMSSEGMLEGGKNQNMALRIIRKKNAKVLIQFQSLFHLSVFFALFVVTDPFPCHILTAGINVFG